MIHNKPTVTARLRTPEENAMISGILANVKWAIQQTITDEVRQAITAFYAAIPEEHKFFFPECLLRVEDGPLGRLLDVREEVAAHDKEYDAWFAEFDAGKASGEDAPDGPDWRRYGEYGITHVRLEEGVFVRTKYGPGPQVNWPTNKETP